MNSYSEFISFERESPSTFSGLVISAKMLGQHSSTPNLLFITLWLFVRACSNFHILLFRVGQFTVWSFKDRCAERFEMQAEKNVSLLSSLFACFNDAVITWPCDVIAVAQFQLWMFNLYPQLELRRQNIWDAGHHKTMANFRSVAYAHNWCWSKYI